MIRETGLWDLRDPLGRRAEFTCADLASVNVGERLVLSALVNARLLEGFRDCTYWEIQPAKN